MPVTIDGTNGITTPTYGGTDTSEYLVPVTGFKNRIINGAMMIDQRNAGASVTNTTSVLYTVDRFSIYGNQASKFTAQQSTTVPSGFINSLKITSSSSYTVGAGEVFKVQQSIEGFNVADLGWGAAGASTVTLSFWVYSSLTGTFGGALSNNDVTRSYPFSYTISSANTWTQISVTISGDTTGTWTKNNTTGILVMWSLGTGSTYSGTAGSWAGTYYASSTGATSVVGTNGATFYITGVQLEKGSTATSFDYRPYGTELALCQRYCFVGTPQANTGGVAANGTQCQVRTPFNVPMRTTPTTSVTSGTWQISDDYSADITATNPTIADSNLGSGGGRVYLTGFSGLTSGRWYAGTAVGTAQLIYSAEL